MNQQELERLIASLTDDELQQIRDYQPDEANNGSDTDADPARTATLQFVKSLIGGDDD